MCSFMEIKQKYDKLRTKQRNEIVEMLDENNFVVKDGKNSGKGVTDYTSKGEFAIPYDNSNWKWIEATLNGKNFLISLQSFNVNPVSKNHLVLYDRIGIYMYDNYKAEEAFTKMKVTDIDLPMDVDKKNKLLQILKSM